MIRFVTQAEPFDLAEALRAAWVVVGYLLNLVEPGGERRGQEPLLDDEAAVHLLVEISASDTRAVLSPEVVQLLLPVLLKWLENWLRNRR